MLLSMLSATCIYVEISSILYYILYSKKNNMDNCLGDGETFHCKMLLEEGDMNECNWTMKFDFVHEYNCYIYMFLYILCP